MTGQGDVVGRLVETVQASLIDCHHGSNCRDTARDAHCWPADQMARAVLADLLPLLADEIDALPHPGSSDWDAGICEAVRLLRDLAVRVAR